MAELISRSALARETGIKKAANLTARFPRLGRRASVNTRLLEYCYTEVEADLIRDAYVPKQEKPLGITIAHPNPELVRSSIRALLQTVSAYYGLESGELTAMNRDPTTMAARSAAGILLQRLGLNVSEIARTLCRDHGTISHMLARANCYGDETMPESMHVSREELWRDIAQLEFQLLLHPDYCASQQRNPHHLDDMLSQALARHPERQQMSAYVRALMPPTKPQPFSVLYTGLRALAADRVARARVLLVLRRYDQEHLGHVMAHHAHKLGFTWEAAS